MVEKIEAIDTVRDYLCKHYKMTEEGSLKACLAVEIRLQKDERRITLSKKGYTLKLFENFNIGDCKPVSTPMEKGWKLKVKADGDSVQAPCCSNLAL